MGKIIYSLLLVGSLIVLGACSPKEEMTPATGTTTINPGGGTFVCTPPATAKTPQGESLERVWGDNGALNLYHLPATASRVTYVKADGSVYAYVAFNATILGNVNLYSGNYKGCRWVSNRNIGFP